MKHVKGRRGRYWVKKYLSSGMSHRGFCRQEGLSESSLYNWRKRYEESTGSSRCEASSFIPLEVLSCEHVLRIESSFKLRTLGGYELEFTSGCKVEELKELLELCIVRFCCIVNLLT